MRLRIHLPVFIDNFHSRQCVAPIVLAVHAVVNHGCEHVNIPEYMEHFKMYTDLGNQGATNAGENVIYIMHTYIGGLLSQSMWGSLRLTPIIVHTHMYIHFKLYF